MAISRVAANFDRLEWWPAHLAGALSARVGVERFLLAEGIQPGYAADMDISEALSGWDPETSFFLGSMMLPFRGINRLKIPTAVWTDYIDEYNRILIPLHRLFDQVFTTMKDSVAVLKKEGCRNVSWLPYAFDTTIRNEPECERIHDVAFVGRLDLPNTKDERRDILSSLDRKYRLNDYRKPVFGDDLMRTYNQARIVVNIPLRVAGGFNMRFFEAMASGALLITKDLGYSRTDLFQPGSHFVTYRDRADLMDKVEYYLRNDRERTGIAQSGMKEVLSKHTYEHRAGEVLHVMESGLCRHGRSPDLATENAALAVYYRYGRHSADLLADLAKSRGSSLKERLRLSATALGKLARRLIR